MTLLRRTWRVIGAQLSSSPRISISQLKRYSSFKNYEVLLKSCKFQLPLNPELSIDLGSSQNPCNIFNARQIIGIDINADEDNPDIIACDLFRGTLPFGTSTVSFITAFDFLEHVPRVHLGEGFTRFPFIDLISEVHRVLKPGGLFFQASPAFPMKEAFQDPTHVNILTEDTFPMYFCTGAHETPWAQIYGFKGEFDLIVQGWVGPRLATLMQKL